MPLYTCSRCHYTFPSVDKPGVCPDCGHKRIVPATDFEFRLKRARHVRIYADVLVITEDKVFSLEFKMKDTLNPEEVTQAAKYVPDLEIVFGPDYEAIPALVLTAAKETFDFVSIGVYDAILPVCSGDMLFNIFDEYLGFLSEGE